MRRTVVALMLVLAIAGATAGGAAGCTRKTNHGIATAGGANPSGSKPSASAAPADQIDQMRQFAKCMRDHGIEMPDPDTSGGGVSFQLGDPADGRPDPTKVDAAMKECKHLLPNGGEPPKADPEQVEQMRQFAKCMREHGVPEFPDPDDSGMLRIDLGNGFDPQDPKMQAAQKECEKYMPKSQGGQMTQKVDK
jgi:hypothetical protein